MDRAVAGTAPSAPLAVAALEAAVDDHLPDQDRHDPAPVVALVAGDLEVDVGRAGDVDHAVTPRTVHGLDHAPFLPRPRNYAARRRPAIGGPCLQRPRRAASK